MMTAAEKIYSIRINKGWTLQDLADATSLHSTYLWELENQPKKKLDIKKISLIAQVFGVKLGSLIDPSAEIEFLREDGLYAAFKLLCGRDQKIIKHIMNVMLNSKPESLKDTDA